MTDKFCVGIIGGMGPLAGVELQRLIIEATHAATDQDHIPVLAFTNPSIPDRTRSLAEDDGRTFTTAVIASGLLLADAGATVLAMPCMTAHSRHGQIQARLPVPLLDAVSLTCQQIVRLYPKRKVILLATDGAVKSQVYTRNQIGLSLNWQLPNPSQQTAIMDVIYSVKAGRTGDVVERLKRVMSHLETDDNSIFVLGCTELGLLLPQLDTSLGSLIDPFRPIACFGC